MPRSYGTIKRCTSLRAISTSVTTLLPIELIRGIPCLLLDTGLGYGRTTLMRAWYGPTAKLISSRDHSMSGTTLQRTKLTLDIPLTSKVVGPGSPPALRQG